MESLKQKSAENQRKEKEKMKALKIINQFMLDKRDALVFKFVINLKQKLNDKKDMTM